MFNRDEFIYVGRVAATAEDSRYRLARLTRESAAVLDVGCAVGYIGEFLRRSSPPRWLAGIEIDPGAADKARPHYDQVIVGSIDDPAVWTQLRRQVDAMIFGDVLEHTADPVMVLRMARPKLSDDGLIVVSIPNIGHFKVRLRLLLGKFDYEDWGIMDRTHLRFFTLKTAQEMLRQGGFTVVHREGVHGYPLSEGLNRVTRVWARSKRRLRAWLTGLRPSVFAYQFILVAVPAPTTVPTAQPAAEAAREEAGQK
ncbi:MAG TPA: class I SAM-dependent methyltransferase [Candidatus Dormibacteraeota bacterium]|nr:class I SAM-dependent methyltransferase [Candidatus Dormibacteraeota bacterium]